MRIVLTLLLASFLGGAQPLLIKRP